MVPSVAINAGSFSFATNTPFKSPNATGIMIVRIMAAINGQPPVLYAYPPMSAPHIMIVPIERSIPPVMITNVTPRARNPTKYADSRIFVINWTPSTLFPITPYIKKNANNIISAPSASSFCSSSFFPLFCLIAFASLLIFPYPSLNFSMWQIS